MAQSVSGVTEKKAFAEEYFDKHSKAVINAMRKSKNLRLTDADFQNTAKIRDIFSGEFAYNPRNFDKRATATRAIKAQLEVYRYGDAEFVEMKENLDTTTGEDIDKRKILRGFKGYVYDWSDNVYEYESEGYWETSDGDKIVIKVNKKLIGTNSPWTSYIVLEKGDVGIYD